jgi:hypothetical protein
LPLRIYPVDHDPDPIADPKDFFGVLPDEAIPLFVIQKIIIGQTADVYQPLDEKLLELHEKPEGGNPTDKAIKLLT